MIAVATTTIGVIIAFALVLGWLLYAIMNRSAARPELGSEMELAPNRRPYYSDEDLEGKRLELVQLIGVLLLVVIVVGLPLYWVLEPDRQAGAEEAHDNQMITWGSHLFATTAEGGFNCAGCHGGMAATGGTAEGTYTDPQTGEVSAVNYIAPALDTVYYRFDEDAVRYILNYGRPGTPMSAWGTPGGGPMTVQNIDSLLAYMWSIQIERVGCAPDEADDPNCPTGHLPADEQSAIQTRAEQLVADGTYGSLGEALFNLDLAGGAYSCARCHTPGWNIGQPGNPGAGQLGWSLVGQSVNAHFPTAEHMEAFIADGTTDGQGYGQGGQGTGRMPGFGAMLTDEQIQAIVEYVRTL